MHTGVPLIDWFLLLLADWGYLIVLGFTIFENLFVVGSLTPGETVVIAASAVAANDQLHLTGVWVASLIGTVIGSNISYLGGRRAGLEGVRGWVAWFSDTRAGKVFRISADGLDDVYEHFHTHGSKTVLISRFAVGAKNFVPAVAGATRMPVFWFELYTVIGAILYTSLMCAIGWFLGANLELALDFARGVGIAGLALFAAMLIALWFTGRRLRRMRRARLAGDDRDEEQ